MFLSLLRASVTAIPLGKGCSSCVVPKRQLPTFYIILIAGLVHGVPVCSRNNQGRMLGGEGGETLATKTLSTLYNNNAN